MVEIIKSITDSCTGCNRCVRVCPMEAANITWQDEAGNIKVRVDNEKCIACGRCVLACKQEARDYLDDTERFFEDLRRGVPISVIAAPSIKTNIYDYKKLFTYLKNLGVNKIYDVSLGADICIWAHVRHMEKTGFDPIITQPCPVIVTYCEKYHHDLFRHLSKVHSPMACTSIYMREHAGIGDRIAAISPCIAKKNEFHDTGLIQYNITYTKLIAYLTENSIDYPGEESGYDNFDSGPGSLFPMPGGLKENIEYFLGKKLYIAKSEGFSVFGRLNRYAETPEDFLPELYDVLNCIEGCNIGPASPPGQDVFVISKMMNESRKTTVDDRKKEYYETVYKLFDDTLDLSRFLREYRQVHLTYPLITKADLSRAFEALGKNTFEKQNVDCGACGSKTCLDMARKVALKVNIPINCIVKSTEEAKYEHEINTLAHKQLMEIEKKREADERMRIMLDATPLVAHFWDENYQITDCNMAAVKMYGLKSKQEYIDRYFELTPEFQPDGSRSEDRLKQLIDLAFIEDYQQVEWMRQSVTGEPIPVELTLVRVEYRGKGLIAGYCRDLREQKRMMQELDSSNRKMQTALEEAENQRMAADAANKAKSSFLSTMSHEIRTPMNAILGITEIQLLDDSLEKPVKDAFDRIYHSGDLLLGIINDILDLSRIEAGKLDIVTQQYSITSLISDTAQLNLMRIGSKPIEFELQIDENMPTFLSGDELRIKQIFNNILSNAFKYTAEGVVKLTVNVEPVPGNDDELTLVVSVSDTGQGMTKEQIDKLFDEYARFNALANRQTEGTGLGMSITQNLIHMMNGEIFVESEPGKGSVFTVRLPQGKSRSEEVLGKEIADSLRQFRSSSRAQMRRVQITREPMPYGSVLIVDDVETNIFVARGLLSAYGLKIEEAGRGMAAIEKVKNGAEYDIIFMDHMMPVMDGIEATKILRGMGYSKPIVALTANAVSGQADMFLRNGFDGFISKPIDIRELNTVLNKFVRDSARMEKFEAAGGLPVADNAVASVDDSNAQAVTTGLEEAVLRDAINALGELEQLGITDGRLDESSLQTFLICVHGLKSAFANAGMLDLSNAASILEDLARSSESGAIARKTPAFLESLRTFILEMQHNETDGDSGAEAAGGDLSVFRDALFELKSSCASYNGTAADLGLAKLKESSWPQHEKALLRNISELILHSDFDVVVDLVDKYLMEGEGQ